MTTDREVLAKTLYYEARGEEEEGIRWVAWVIKNRALMNKKYWGGSSIRAVCLHDIHGHKQFECWVKKDVGTDIPEDDAAFRTCQAIADEVIGADEMDDPTKGCDHYNNPDKEGFPPWTENCTKAEKIGDHQFYRSEEGKALRRARRERRRRLP